MQLKNIFVLVLSVLCTGVWAQQIAPINGVATPSHTIVAFTNAHLIVSASNQIENGTLLIQDGKVLASGAKVSVPKNAIIYDLNGKFIYPSFIELYSNYGMPKVLKRKQTPQTQFASPNNGSLYWNEAIHPELEVSQLFKVDAKKAKELYQMGFGVALSHQFNGIMRGNAVLVSLAENPNESVILKSNAGACFGFGKGNSSQSYPTSLMGSIALFRQANYDAQWYQTSKKSPINISLQAIEEARELPQFFVANNYQNILRVAKIGEEFKQAYITISGGDAYKHIQEIKGINTRLVVPLNFPKPYDVSDPFDAEYVSLSSMKHWELAPSNPAILAENEIPFALSATANPKMFWKNVRKSIQYGLDPKTALAALTSIPAEFLNLEDEMGTLEKGKMANFFVADADVFLQTGNILENWIGGERYVINNAIAVDPSGSYNMNLNGEMYSVIIVNGPKGYRIKSSFGGSEKEPQKGKITIENNLLTILFQKGTDSFVGPVTMVGKVNFKGKIIDGQAKDANGVWSSWTAIKQDELVDSEQRNTLESISQQGKVFYPNMAFGDTILLEQKNYYISNAMIWPCDSTPNFKGSVIIENGKIAAVGKSLGNPKSYEIIDGAGLHLTPGLIDEHSHIAISRGVNEGGQANSAEVRIGDVLNPDDINIYRQLAGGVTTAQLLHGSANPIGGQAQIIKLRWGSGPEELKLQSNSKSIKFALGENVKHSNWGNKGTVRFPQTRMGVEQVYVDAFARAKAYQKEWQGFTPSSNKKKKNASPTPRRDLELDALVEILNDERYITCHSYIQSEITMLMNVADSMGFRINTFTHILEGYKVADKMKAHGAYASTFSDWWAYKFEVNDAIPYNAAILTKQGVVTAINSDDAEMGRRLNQEAAKTVKYGGMTEVEAMNMVTINPATMLHIDDKVGSITVGKDADLVLWTDHPLSVYAHPKMVMIDGSVYFSAERNELLMAQNKKERQRIIMLMMKAKTNGSKTQKVEHKKPHLYHCDSFGEEVKF